MRINRLIAAVAVVGQVVLTSNVLALEPAISLPRAAVLEAGPRDEGSHDSVPPSGANACPADNVGVLVNGSTIVGSTIGLDGRLHGRLR